MLSKIWTFVKHWLLPFAVITAILIGLIKWTGRPAWLTNAMQKIGLLGVAFAVLLPNFTYFHNLV